MKLVNQQQALMVYLKHLKEKIAISEDRSSKLMTENQSLKIRAAVAWEELTPRPDYTKTFEVLSLSPQIFSGKSSKQIIEEITEQISKNVNFGSQNSLKERAIKVFTRTKNSSSRTYVAPKISISRNNSKEISDEIEENKYEKKKSDVCFHKKNTLQTVEENKKEDGKKLSPSSATRKILQSLEKAETAKKNKGNNSPKH